ncbi:MAG: hypothetical protein ACYDA2_00150 [Acidimicrobiales bacterium]
MGSTLMVALSPWLVLAISARSGGLGMGWGSALSAVVALAVAGRTYRTHRALRPFEVASTLLFTAMALVAVFAPTGAVPGLDDYARTIAAGALAVMAFSSLLWRPLTMDFTTERAPAWFAASAVHRRVNQVLTLLVGAGATIAALSYVAGVSVHHTVGLTVFNWYVPFGVVAAGAALCISIWRAALEAAEEAVGGREELRTAESVFAVDRRRDHRPRLQLVVDWPSYGEAYDESSRGAR